MSERFDIDDLLGLAGDLDEGFSAALLAEMLASHRRFSDDDLVALGGDPLRVRELADAWARRLQEREQ